MKVIIISIALIFALYAFLWVFSCADSKYFGWTKTYHTKSNE